MAVYYRCSGCGQEHPSRFRARDQQTLEALVPVGDFMEPCPVTGEWVTVCNTALQWGTGAPVMEAVQRSGSEAASTSRG
jgi:hypothetical protein